MEKHLYVASHWHCALTLHVRRAKCFIDAFCCCLPPQLHVLWQPQIVTYIISTWKLNPHRGYYIEGMEVSGLLREDRYVLILTLKVSNVEDNDAGSDWRA